MKINTTPLGESLVFLLEGRLDVINGPRLQEQLIDSITSPDGCRHIVLDFAKLTYISSSGMRVLLSAQKAAVTNQKLLTLCNVSDGIRELLDLVGLLNILPIQESPASKALD